MSERKTAIRMSTHKNLRVKNFATFESAEFEWSPGVNVLIGPNGTGKSHILRLLFALAHLSIDPESKVERSSSTLTLDSHTRLFLQLIDSLGRAGAKASLSGEYSDPIEGIQQWELEVDESSTTLSKLPGILPTVLIPSESVMAHTKGFLALWHQRNIDFEPHYADLIEKLLIPELRELSEESMKLVSLISDAIHGEFILVGERFIFKQSGSAFEAPDVAEGFQKMGILQRLIQTGALVSGSVLLWDEPENQLHPKLLGVVAQVLVGLAKLGVQVVCTTHSYLLLKELEFLRPSNDSMRFFSLQFISSGAGLPAVHVSSSRSLAGLEPNEIIDQQLQILERSLDANW